MLAEVEYGRSLGSGCERSLGCIQNFKGCSWVYVGRRIFCLSLIIVRSDSSSMRAYIRAGSRAPRLMLCSPWQSLAVVL